MKTLLISGLALAILTSAALAQPAEPPPPPGAPPPVGTKAPPPPPPGGPDAMNDEGPGGPAGPGGPHGYRPPPPPPSKAAHFHLKNGDLTFDVKCADEDATKACADSVLELLEKLQAAPKP